MSVLTLMAEWSERAISLSCSNLGLLPRISGSQNWGTAPFMCPIFPWAGAGALTHCEGSRPTPHTIYACVSVLGARCCGLTFSVDGIGWVIREWRDEVRLGMIRLVSPWSRVPGRASRSLVRGREKEGCVLNDGAIVACNIVIPQLSGGAASFEYLVDVLM